MRLAVIIGSVREGRVGPTVAHWFAAEAGRHGRFDIDVVDLADIRLPLDMSAGSEHDGDAFAARLAEADAFAVVTPEYNHGYPAALKNAIDWNTGQWRAKPVGFVSYGGQSGGSRAVEQLRPVLAEAHAMTLRETVSVSNPWDEFAPDGLRCDESRWAARAKRLLDQLAWWCRALKDAREKDPYEN